MKKKPRLTGSSKKQIEESRGLLWLLGEVNGGVVVAPCPDNKKDHIAFQIKHTKPKLISSYAGEQLKMHVEIEEEGTIVENNCKDFKISKPETIKKLEDLQDKKIEERIMMTIKKRKN